MHDRGLNGLEEKERSNLLHNMESQFNLRTVGVNEEDRGLFGITWSALWDKSGLDKLGWIDVVHAARASSRNCFSRSTTTR